MGTNMTIGEKDHYIPTPALVETITKSSNSMTSNKRTRLQLNIDILEKALGVIKNKEDKARCKLSIKNLEEQISEIKH